MRVRLGWSGEIEPNVWSKADVELEEEDLQRMFYAADLPVDHHWNVPTKICFHLLKNEAEALLLARLITQGYPQDKAEARIATLEQQNAVLLNAVRVKTDKASV